MIDRILIIRGGAIGDFILTLPAIRLLRIGFPMAKLEILGNPHIAQLAVGRNYATAARDIHSASLAGFFGSGALDPVWSAYFAGFQCIVSYLYDQDQMFSANLCRAGAKHLIQGNPKIGPGSHASFQLARPLEHRLRLFLEDPAATLYPSSQDYSQADQLLRLLGIDAPFLVLHPGSGSEHKNWPIPYWIQFCDWILKMSRPIHRLICVGGEADRFIIGSLKSHLAEVAFIEDTPLPVLGALLSRAYGFVGHDSGIAHIAAAAGAPCLLLYGPTDPEIWAPKNPLVRVIQSPTSLMKDLSLEAVCKAFEAFIDVL